MRTLEKKLLRDLRRLSPQLAAVAAVTACGVAMVVMSWSMLASLAATQRAEYAAARFPDLFVHLRKAPEVVARRLAALPGIERVETRIVEEVTIRFPGQPAAPVSGRLVSLPAEEGLCLLHLFRGRMPEGSGREILVSAGFAEARGLEPGDRVEAVLSGSLASFTIVGIATSPEYVWTIPPGVPFPDDRSFGVLWLDRRSLAAAFDLEDAFNDVVATLAPGADERDAAAALDAERDLEIVADLVSEDAVRVAPGDQATIESWGGERPLEARVRLVEPRGFTKVSPLGVEEQRVNVILDLVSPAEERPSLGDDFRVDVSIEIDRVDDAVLVPLSALFRSGSTPAVFVVESGRARLVPLAIGRRGDRLAEVTEGLSGGEQVIEYPPDTIRDGAAVRPRSLSAR